MHVKTFNISYLIILILEQEGWVEIKTLIYAKILFLNNSSFNFTLILMKQEIYPPVRDHRLGDPLRIQFYLLRSFIFPQENFFDFKNTL